MNGRKNTKDMVSMDKFGSRSNPNSPLLNRHRATAATMHTLSPNSCYRRKSLRSSQTFQDFTKEEKIIAARKLSDQPLSPRNNHPTAPLIWDGEGNILFNEEETMFTRSKSYILKGYKNKYSRKKSSDRRDAFKNDEFIKSNTDDSDNNNNNNNNNSNNGKNRKNIDNKPTKTATEDLTKQTKLYYTHETYSKKDAKQKRKYLKLGRRKSASFSDFGVFEENLNKHRSLERTRSRSETGGAFFDTITDSPKMLRLRKQHAASTMQAPCGDEKAPHVRVDTDSDEDHEDGRDKYLKDRDILHGETPEDAEMRKQALTMRTRRRSSFVQIPTASIQMDLHSLYLESINANKGKKGKIQEEPKRKLEKKYTGHGSIEGGDDEKKSGRFASIILKFKKDDSVARTLEDFREFKEHLRSNLTEVSDHELAKYKDAHWSTLGSCDDDLTVNENVETKLSDQERKRFEALWELLYAEISYLVNNLIVIHDVFAKPLEHAKSYGFLANVDEEILFANLQSLIDATSEFAKNLLKMFKERGTSFNRSTEIIVDAFKTFDQTLTQEYKQYSVNYQNAKAHVESLNNDEIFQEFIKHCEQDSRCNRRHLEDFLVAPLQHLTKYPLLLKAIRKHSPQGDRNSHLLTTTIIDIEQSIKSVEKRISSLMNQQRIQEIQKAIVWPVFVEMEKKQDIPDFVRNDLNINHNVTVLMNPNRILLQEGPINLTDKDKSELYLFLFDDMLLLTKPKKKVKAQRRNTGPEEKLIAEAAANKMQQLYTVFKQPLPVDRLKIYDCDDQVNSTGNKNSFCLVNFNRYHQAVGGYTFQTASPEEKTIWLKNLRKAKEDATSEGFSSAKDISSDEEYM